VTERELSQLAACGNRWGGWDDSNAGLSGNVLRFETNRAPLEVGYFHPQLFQFIFSKFCSPIEIRRRFL